MRSKKFFFQRIGTYDLIREARDSSYRAKGRPLFQKQFQERGGFQCFERSQAQKRKAYNIIYSREVLL